MADVKQAAKWMSEGKLTTTSTHRIYRMEPLPDVCPLTCAFIEVFQAGEWGSGWALQMGDLLTDTWEIADPPALPSSKKEHENE